jgi:hypothetical protein
MPRPPGLYLEDCGMADAFDVNGPQPHPLRPPELTAPTFAPEPGDNGWASPVGSINPIRDLVNEHFPVYVSGWVHVDKLRAFLLALADKFMAP